MLERIKARLAGKLALGILSSGTASQDYWKLASRLDRL